jgi:acetylglutamate kinase
VPGVLRDKDDASTRMPRLTRAEAQRAIAQGTIVGGMIPKVEESLAMLEQGVEAIHIVGVEPPLALLEEAREAGSRGTAFVR